MSVRTTAIRTIAAAATAGLLATLFTASAASAATNVASNAAEAPPPVSAKTQPNDEKRLYCVRLVPTGTRIEREKCMTRAQWADRGFDVNNPHAN